MSRPSNTKMPKKQRTGLAGARYRKYAKAVQESKDDLIMGTNDSSIVSKRSVSKLYFPEEPDFYEPFVGKYVRRNPLINRGYWLRMHAVEQVVRRFLEEAPQRPKVLVNLGCGYTRSDPLPFQFWHRYPSLCHNAVFVDVDYPSLIERKRDRILTNALLREALLRTNLRSSSMPVHLRSDGYMALGCDLKDLSTLETALKKELDISSSSILFVGEVSLTYMPWHDSDALIRWASAFDDAQFCLLEQFLPQGPEHPFAQTMLKHFNKLQTPILAINEYPQLHQQQDRFHKAGWPILAVASSLWELWSNDSFTPREMRRDLDVIEPFDEWEEFALFAGHYFLIVASNISGVRFDVGSQKCQRRLVVPDCSNGTKQHVVLKTQSLGEGNPLTSRRFGAAFALGSDAFGCHGGQGTERRLANIDMLWKSNARFAIETSPMPQARMCHTMTVIDGANVVLIGGRTSPSHPLADCWLLRNGLWQEIQGPLPPRFRHTSTKVIFSRDNSKVEGILVFGGKTSGGSILDDWSLVTSDQGWKQIPVVGSRPPPRFGAAMSTLDSAHDRGLLLGGMDCDGTIMDDVWEWHLSAAPGLHIHFTNRSADIQCQPPSLAYARLGGTLLPFGDSLLLFGGVCKDEIVGLLGDFLLIHTEATVVRVERPTVKVANPTNPLLVGIGAAAMSKNEITVAGGGAVCFSMGSFWNTELLQITKVDSPMLESWSPSTFEPEKAIQELSKPSRPQDEHRDSRNSLTHGVSEVPRIRLHCSEDFTQLLASSKPAVIEGLDLGPCTELWSLEYLKEKIGIEREVVVHECKADRMTFKNKNFEYIKKPVGEFLDSISKGAKAYLRAVSASQPNKTPTKLEDDFPTISADFKLPDVLQSIRQSYHSSPLRISGPVSLWLHYDVLANVLCQIRGTKTLRLYPPSDVRYLDFPPGGSSSNVNVLASKDARLQHTHPHIAALKPRDILFIPPMWSHTATPGEGISVAVNVFFRNLSSGYAAGKDVYGNRDLQAYENGRRDVERIAKAFKGVPQDLAKFYLDRLAAELQDKSDGLQER